MSERLEHFRQMIEDEEGMGYGELYELQSLADQIDPSDVTLLEAAGVPEFPEPEDLKEYGVTWATFDHSVAQTGYDFTNLEDAMIVAERGPWAYRAGRVDGMCEHYPNGEVGQLYGRIETRDDSVAEVDTVSRGRER